MRSYKLVLLLKSDLGKEKKKKLLDQVETWAGAKETKTEELGEKKLAYVIKRERKGDYVALSFGSDKISTDFEKRLVIQEDILRHLMVRMK
ncbi:MAG: 30S ribosomal protein S6 [Candidatus Levyibacteriota bacterium]